MARFSMILLSVVAVVFANEAYDDANTDDDPNISDAEFEAFLAALVIYEKPYMRRQFSPISGPISSGNFTSTMDDLFLIFEAAGAPPSEYSAAQVAALLDVDNSGSIEASEFDVWYGFLMNSFVAGYLKDQMEGEDKVITKEEFILALTNTASMLASNM